MTTIAGMSVQEAIEEMCDGDKHAKRVRMGSTIPEDCTPVLRLLSWYVDDMKAAVNDATQELHHAARLLWLTAD